MMAPWYTPKSRLTETTSLVTSDTSWRPRKMTFSMAAPNSGAMTQSITRRAKGAGQPHSTRRRQYMKAASIPNAPWAKLKMPEVV